MSKIITIAGQRGGTGKSVTAVNLATSLALLEKKTLLIDCDPQGCSTQLAGLTDMNDVLDITSVLAAKARFKDAILKTEFHFLDMMPSNFNLFQVALKLSKTHGNEKVLGLLLKDVEDEYEYIIIDTPSSYDFLTISAITAAEDLLICMTPGQSSIFDFQYLLKIIKYIKTVHGVSVNIAGVLFNRCCSCSEIDRFLQTQGLTDIRKMVLKAFIPEDEAVKKSIQLKIPLALNDIKSLAAQAYLKAAEEMHFSFNERGGL